MTKRSQIPFPSLVLCILMLVPGVAAAGPILAGVSFTGTGTAGFADGFSRMLGWRFTVGSNPIAVTALGFQDFGDDGLLETHEVGIWRLSDQALIVSAIVPQGDASTVDGHFQYVSLSSIPTLQSGTEYLISGFDNGIDRHVWDSQVGSTLCPSFDCQNIDVSGFAVDSAITLGATGTAHGPVAPTGFGFPGTGTVGGGADGRSALLGPNLKFSVTSVPEPTTLALLSLGLLGLRGKGGNVSGLFAGIHRPKK